MDHNIARTLSLIALLFLGIEVVLVILVVGLNAFLLAGLVSVDEMNSSPCVCGMILFLCILILPAVTCYIGWGFHHKLKDKRLKEHGEVMGLVTLMIMSFICGNIVSAILYLMILISLGDIIRSQDMPPGMYYGAGYPPYYPAMAPPGTGYPPPPYGGGFQTGMPPPPPFGPDLRDGKKKAGRSK